MAETLEELRERARRVCGEIQADMERDVAAFQGRPFDGRTVGEMHGNLAAAISALAGIVRTLLPPAEGVTADV